MSEIRKKEREKLKKSIYTKKKYVYRKERKKPKKSVPRVSDL